MKFTLTVDIGEDTARIIDDLLVELSSRAGFLTDRRIQFVAGESGYVLNSHGTRAGSWRLSDRLSCAHGPVPRSHGQYKRAKLALWCEECQEFYPTDL